MLGRLAISTMALHLAVSWEKYGLGTMMSGSGAERRRLVGGHDHDHDLDHGEGDDEGDEETSIMQFKDVSTKTPTW